jgi:hypothetical protein
LVICQESGNKFLGNEAHFVKILANSTRDPNGVCKLMDCSTTVFVDEFSNFFSTFSVVMLALGRSECSSSSTDTLLALKLNAIQKPLSRLTNVF